MSLAERPTDDEVRSAFEELIAGPDPDGSDISTDTGLDQRTLAAIERVWAGTSPALIEAARQELELQLDGTHAQEDDAEAMDIFARALNTE